MILVKNVIILVKSVITFISPGSSRVDQHDGRTSSGLEIKEEESSLRFDEEMAYDDDVIAYDDGEISYDADVMAYDDDVMAYDDDVVAYDDDVIVFFFLFRPGPKTLRCLFTSLIRWFLRPVKELVSLAYYPYRFRNLAYYTSRLYNIQLHIGIG